MSTMHIARVGAWGESPKYLETPTPSAPGEDQVQIKVLASGVHSLVRVLSSGKHYVVPPLPYIPGSDGVGEIPSENNRKVYFMSMAGGAFQEYVNVPRKMVYDLPEGLDPVQVAALVNPGQSSWIAIKTRTNDLPKNFNALILGATSMSGKVAAPLLRQMGAGKVYGVARNEAAMSELGLDKTATLQSPPENTDWATVASDVDVVLDYIYGDALLALLKAIKPGRRVQVIQIGSVGGGLMSLDAGILRGRDVVLSGQGLGTMTDPGLVRKEYFAMFDALKNVPKQKVKESKLSEIESEWPNAKERLVFIP